MKIKLISSLVLSLFAASANADKAADRYTDGFKSKFRIFMEVGAQSGGDGSEPLPLYDRASGNYFTGIPYTLVGNWNGVSDDLEQFWEDDVEAGGLYKFAAGVEIPLMDNLIVMASLGYQLDEVYGDLLDGSGGKGSLQYQRTTFELIPFYSFGKHRFGIGAEVHVIPEASHKEYANGFSLKSTYDFETALGAVLRYDYWINDNVSVGLKYTDMAYDFEKISTLYTVGGATAFELEADCSANCEEVVEANSVGIHITYRF